MPSWMAERCVFTILGFEWAADLRRVGPFRSQVAVWQTFPRRRVVGRERHRHSVARRKYEQVLAGFREVAALHHPDASNLLTFTYDPFLGERLRGDP